MKKVFTRGLQQKAFFIALIVAASGCSIFERSPDARESLLRELGSEQSSEIANHLEFLGDDFLRQLGPRALISISARSKNYLNEMHQRIVTNNELVFEKFSSPKFYIIRDTTPFHFSLPGGHYFLSQGLMRKYLANEDLLAAVMAIEIFRAEKGIFEKRSVVPNGNVGIERMLLLLRLDIETRGEINKWAYLLMRRAGYDPGALLNLIQLKNKNALDFASSVGNISSISREEFNYKNFLSRTPGETSEEIVEKNSARGFYALRSDIL